MYITAVFDTSFQILSVNLAGSISIKPDSSKINPQVIENYNK